MDDRSTRLVGGLSISLLTGFVLLFFSVPFGQSRANNWLSLRGGASPEEYAVIVEQSITVFIVLGGILLAASLLWVVLLLVKSHTHVSEVQKHVEKDE